MRQKSEKLYERALNVIPGGVNSPVRAFRSVGGIPVFMESGNAQFVRDTDGNEYLDFCNSWGPLICGHRPKPVIDAISAQIEKSLTLGTPTESEVLLAEEIIRRHAVRSVEKIRFVSSGTEAVMSAIRLARGFTSRSKIIKFEGCYHGHSDSLLVKAGSGLVTFGQPDSSGVPVGATTDTIVLPLDDESVVEDAFQKYGEQIAAVIIEPVPANNGLLIQREEYLKFLRSVTQRHGALLIFDEVINGFRLGFSGAAGHYGIEPDLITYGKIIGGGMPAGAFAGRSDIFKMIAPDGPVYQAGTLSGNPVAMNAGLAQLQMLTDDLYKNLETRCNQLVSGFNNKGYEWKLTAIGSIFWFFRGETPPRRADRIDSDSMKTYAKLFHHMLDNGVYMAPSGYEVGFISAPMTEKDIERFLGLAAGFFES